MTTPSRKRLTCALLALFLAGPPALAQRVVCFPPADARPGSLRMRLPL